MRLVGRVIKMFMEVLLEQLNTPKTGLTTARVVSQAA